MSNDLLMESLSEPLNSTTRAKLDINSGVGNLTIDRLEGGEGMLAGGTLQYFEKQGPPVKNVTSSDGETVLTVKGNDAGLPWFHFPWEVCNGVTEWQIHLNPGVPSEIAAHSGGGNVRLELAGMTVRQVTADTGGGNMDVVLPDEAGNLDVAARTGAGNVSIEVGRVQGTGLVNARSGAGNVTIHIPREIPAKVHASCGLGKVMVDSHFYRIDRDTYQSPDYDSAMDKVEIVANSGAGNVTVDTR